MIYDMMDYESEESGTDDNNKRKDEVSQKMFHLKWNDSSTMVPEIYYDYYENEVYVDVTMVCQGRMIKAHRLVLGTCSEFFYDYFMMNEGYPVVIIDPSIELGTLRAILSFVYKGEITVTPNDIVAFMRAINKFNIYGISKTQRKLIANMIIQMGLEEPSYPTITTTEVIPEDNKLK